MKKFLDSDKVTTTLKETKLGYNIIICGNFTLYLIYIQSIYLYNQMKPKI